MKKFLISLYLIILAHFCAINIGLCAEDFFIDTNFQESKNKVSIPKKATFNKPIEEEEGFFSKLFKKKKNTKFNYSTNKEEEIPQGYYGSLPDIEKDFKYKQQSSNSSIRDDLKVIDENEIENQELKKAPYDDTLFLDVIIKKEKASNYINDVQKTKFALNNLKKCLEEQGDIQRFNGCVNMIDMLVKNLKNKYENTSDSLRESYVDILNTNYHAKTLGNLRYDANYYSRYIPTQQGKYSKENILLEQEKLLNLVNKTIFLINQES